MLGKQENCVYLVDGGDTCAILGGGLAAIIPDIEEQLATIGVDPKRIKSLVILHSHFDHCGIVPYFKNKWPWVEVVASERAKTLLSNPKALANIEKFNSRHLEETLPHVDPGDLCIDGFTIEVERVVNDGDMLTCGDVNLQVLETPGHSTCSISLYMPEEKAIFVSDAVGISLGDKVFTAANSNFDHYMQSLEKIFAFNPRSFCQSTGVAGLATIAGNSCPCAVRQPKICANSWKKVSHARATSNRARMKLPTTSWPQHQRAWYRYGW